MPSPSHRSQLSLHGQGRVACGGIEYGTLVEEPGGRLRQPDLAVSVNQHRKCASKLLDHESKGLQRCINQALHGVVQWKDSKEEDRASIRWEREFPIRPITGIGPKSLIREKYTLEQDIRDMEEAIRHKSAEVQEMQNELDRETSSLQELEAQKQDAQDRLEEMEQQKHKLEDMLNEVRLKCQEESHLISSLQSQIHSQESDLQSQEEELSRAKADLDRLHQEERQLEQNLAAGKIQLETIISSLKSTQEEINQARSKLSQIQDSQQDMSKGIEQFNSSLNATNGGSMTNLADMSEGFSDRESTGKGKQVSPSTCPSTDPSLVPVWTTLISELLMC
ncbi:PREDICTED: epidermal growth factor receptor substrate 15-like 1 [Cyprinodon variegatus]|uniref:epidermal growth factor receptor substrate 15-like 1 n=1 Tax=Cyprinodon variegatus TaxID=28743 RepID=UPI00074286CA|nr:PREDICTED: epidermal growth factor receptor substrate 15-like 1 [Cyprinodon variegatus]